MNEVNGCTVVSRYRSRYTALKEKRVTEATIAITMAATINLQPLHWPTTGLAPEALLCYHNGVLQNTLGVQNMK